MCTIRLIYNLCFHFDIFYCNFCSLRLISFYYFRNKLIFRFPMFISIYWIQVYPISRRYYNSWLRFWSAVILVHNFHNKLIECSRNCIKLSNKTLVLVSIWELCDNGAIKMNFIILLIGMKQLFYFFYYTYIVNEIIWWLLAYMIACPLEETMLFSWSHQSCCIVNLTANIPVT